MFGRRKPKASAAKEPKPAVLYTVKCPNGCMKMDCSTLHQAEGFQKRVQRCPQCGGELVIYPYE
ncbi:MAG: hypothetical protein IJV41_04035 [Oscillospiraceae bacterium]|nr:hypothetical protein [Oscillospiraceae bacterium]